MIGQDLPFYYEDSVVKNIRIVAWILVFIVVGFMAYQKFVPSELSDTEKMALVQGEILPYALTSHLGAPVSHTDFSGRYQLVYFGYSFCPTFCPTDLSRMSAALTMLEKQGVDVSFVQPIFITIDPARDTVAQMADTVSLYHPSLLGLTGSEEEIKAVADTFQVYFKKDGDPEAVADYLMSHMNIIFLLNKEGRRIHMFGHESTAADIAKVLLQVRGL